MSTTQSIYIQNKYHTWYHNIIANAQSQDRAKGNSQYYESHHIIPKSLNGSDENSNLILLTAREHFICHALLVRFTIGKNKKSMVYAFNMICTTSQEERYINSRLYESNRIKFAKLVSEQMLGNTLNLGKKFSEEHKQKLSIKKSGKNHPNYGKKLPEKTKQRISIAKSGKKHHNYGKKFSEETKQRMSIAQLGKNNHGYKGDYHTPWGIFETSYQAATDLINYSTIQRWCSNPDKIISKLSLSHSIYLKQLPESPLGKTFREIGFWFIPKTIEENI